MGLSISFVCTEKGGFLAKKINSKNVLNIVESLAKKFDYEFFSKENYFNIKFCPNGIIDMNIVNGDLEGEIDTSACGPGFHKQAVTFIDAFAKKMNIYVDVDDDTTYWTDRDFQKMQNDHVKWMEKVVTGIASYSTSKYLVCWQNEVWEPAIEEGFIAPTMYYKIDEVYDVMSVDIYAFAKKFFIWFNETKDSYFYRGCALYMMWNEFCWVKPSDISQNEKAEKIIKNLNIAFEKDKNIEIPNFEYSEIYRLIGDEKKIVCNDFKNFYEVGYRKNNLIYYFEEGWKAIIPGAMIDDLDDGVYSFIDGERDIRASFLEIKKADKDLDELKKIVEEVKISTDSIIIHELENYKYIAEIKEFTENLEKKYQLRGKIFSETKTATINIIWKNQIEIEWAKNLFLSFEGPDTI